MLELLTWLESTALAGALRGAGVWTYGILNLGHILGLSMLFGSVLILDLRLLGLWRETPLSAVTGPTVPLAGIGFVTAATTGILMISFNATEYYGNPFLYIKLPAIAVGLVNVLVIAMLPAWRAKGERVLSVAEQRQLAAAGGVSLAAWLTAVAAGRMIGYW
jgi:hypothetical protein